MKYFTIDNWIADQDLGIDPSRTLVAGSEYKRYFESVRDRLPEAYLRLNDEWYLHDSTVSAFQIDSSARSALLRLTSWKHDRSGGRLRILYHGAGVVRLESDPDKGLPGPQGFGDFGYDEIEVLAEDLFEHRILFSSGIEIGITFRRLEYEEERDV